MKIDITAHYFRYYDGKSEIDDLNGFSVGEIVTDWNGDTSCILTICKNGDVRTDSNGVGDISQLKKLHDKVKINKYLQDLFSADMYFIRH